MLIQRKQLCQITNPGVGGGLELEFEYKEIMIDCLFDDNLHLNTVTKLRQKLLNNFLSHTNN